MKIYIIRHGETTANTQGVFQGHTDNPLNDMGEHMAVVTGERMTDIHFDAAFSSPLKRSYDTARLLLENSGNNIDIEIDERIKEINMGQWEGKQCFGGELPKEKTTTFFLNPFEFGHFPDGEDTYEVCERTQDFLKELATKDYETVLVSTHGFALRCMLNFLYENPSDFWQGHAPYNCSISIVDVTDGKLTLEAMDKVYYDEDEIVDHYQFNPENQE